jgi:hypothetical protein
MTRRRPSVDALKRARDGHLRYDHTPPRPPALAVVSKDPVTGHTFRSVEGMGTVEYAPVGCTCAECKGRQR